MRANSLNFSLYWRFHFFIYCLHRFWLPAVIPLSSHTVTRERFTAVSAVHTFLVSSFNPIGVIVLFTSTLSRPEPLRWGSSFILALSPPAPCGTGSVYHRLDLHCYYGFVRLLITHCFGFPIRLFLCYLFPFI